MTFVQEKLVIIKFKKFFFYSIIFDNYLEPCIDVRHWEKTFNVLTIRNSINTFIDSLYEVLWGDGLLSPHVFGINPWSSKPNFLYGWEMEGYQTI